jgi:tight adherence protein C
MEETLTTVSKANLALLSAAWAAAAALMGWYVASIAKQITYVTLADGRQQSRTIPLLFRLLLPLAPNLTPLFRRPVFNRARTRLDQQLISAGFEGLLRADELLALRLLLPMVIAPIWMLWVKLCVTAGNVPMLTRIEPMLHILGWLYTAYFPIFWLRRTLQTRHRSIQRALPFVLDLLTLSVEAGLDFMNALQRNVERRAVDPLGEELIRVVREIQVGKTRRDALRAMGLRVGLTDLRQVVNALVQADELGVSIGSILRIQADQMRMRRFERAERLAHEAPVKMLGPLMVFIFPAVFIVLMGPVVYQMVLQGGL